MKREHFLGDVSHSCGMKPPSQRECTYLYRQLWFPGRLFVLGRGWKLEKEKDRKWSGREWLINNGNKHILRCPQLIPGRAKSKCDRSLKESQANSVSFEINPLMSSFLGFWLEEEVYPYFFFWLYFCCFCCFLLPPSTCSWLHQMSFGELIGRKLLLCSSSQMLDEVGLVGSTLWTPRWLLNTLCHQQ